MLESYIFRQISAKFLPKTKSSTIVETLFWDVQFCKRLFSTISKHDFSQNVGLVLTSNFEFRFWVSVLELGFRFRFWV